jgi:hypothetical protein
MTNISIELHVSYNKTNHSDHMFDTLPEARLCYQIGAYLSIVHLGDARKIIKQEHKKREEG